MLCFGSGQKSVRNSDTCFLVVWGRKGGMEGHGGQERGETLSEKGVSSGEKGVSSADK